MNKTFPIIFEHILSSKDMYLHPFTQIIRLRIITWTLNRICFLPISTDVFTAFLSHFTSRSLDFVLLFPGAILFEISAFFDRLKSRNSRDHKRFFNCQFTTEEFSMTLIILRCWPSIRLSTRSQRILFYNLQTRSISY